MNNLFFIFLAISLLFLVILLVKTRVKREFCVICSSFGLIWIFLLFLYFYGKFDDVIILSMLIGMSILGVYYLVEEKVKRELHVFRLPFLLALIFVFYSLLEFNIYVPVLILILVLWVIFSIVFLYRKKGKMKLFFDNLLECCKRW